MFDLLYRALLRTCPADIRLDAGEEMLAMARYGIELEASRRGAAGRVWGRVRSLCDLALFAVTARREARQRRMWSVSPLSPEPRRPFLMIRDVRFAFRQMRARPLFAATVVLMLALGIGSTTAIFSVVNGVLLTPLDLPHPERIVEVLSRYPARNLNDTPWAEANTWDLRDLSHSFSDLGAIRNVTLSLTGDGDPERVAGSQVSVGFLRVLGAAPIAGRVFAPGEDDPGAPNDRAILTERLWTRRYNRDPNIVGTTITLDGRPVTVIGVTAQGPVWLSSRDVFILLPRREEAGRKSWELTVIARLAPGVTMEAANRDVDGVAKTLQQYKENEGMSAFVRSSDAWMASPELKRALWVMLAAVVLLLVIASVNVTNLLFVRASSRMRERAVRTALGAGRADLIRESLTESMLLSFVGAAVGWAIAAGMLSVFKAQDPGGIPRLATVSIDGMVLLFTLGTTLLVGVITGLVPALRVPFGQITAALRDGQRGSIGDRKQDRTRSAFVVIEVAVSVLLLVGAALLVQSLHNVLASDRGFATADRLTAEISIPGAYDPRKRSMIAQDIVARVGQLPQVQSVGYVSGAMLQGGGTGMSFASAGAMSGTDRSPWTTWRMVTPAYFDTIGLRMMAGRNFDSHDRFGEPRRAIISDRLAKQVWPGENPIGKMATLWKGQDNLSAEVIGVVSDMREHRLDGEPTLSVYLPADQIVMSQSTVRLVIHTRGAAETAAEPLRAVVKSIDPSLPVSRVRSIESLVETSVATRRFTMKLLTTFAVVAAFLALAGVSGVLAYSMSQRRSEMGLRLALGARHSQLLAVAMRIGMLPVAFGLVAGTAAALWLSQLMTSLLYGVKSFDPLTYAGVVIALLAAAGLACYLPASRVLRIDPCVALRD